MLLSVNEIRESEKYTMQSEPIASIDLMERASTRFVEHLSLHIQITDNDNIAVFCGPGNNGGDGLVIARLLAQQGHRVQVILCTEEMKTTPEFETNLARLSPNETLNIFAFSQFEKNYNAQKEPFSLIIDAIFGIGLSRPLTGYFAKAVEMINNMNSTVISVDAPSGLFLDQHTPISNKCVKADITLTFQFAKEAFLFPENSKRVGNFEIIDIGLKVQKHSERTALITPHWVRQNLRWPDTFAHKGTQGFGLLIAGSHEMPGAAFMAAKASLRGGIGKVMLHSVKRVTDILPISVPEAILHTDSNETEISTLDIETLAGISAIAVGPGIGTKNQTVTMLKNLIDDVRSPMIFDADALNILSNNKTWLAYLPPYSILTPHRKEFERLAGKSSNDFELRDKLSAFSQKYNIIVILKGAYTSIAFPDGSLRYNTTGNPGMATAGSGDVLTGLLLALMANGYRPTEAALLGVFLHGLAGDEALNEQSEQSLMATDIIENIGKAFNRFK